MKSWLLLQRLLNHQPINFSFFEFKYRIWTRKFSFEILKTHQENFRFFIVHTKTRNELEQAGTTWNELELPGTSRPLNYHDSTVCHTVSLPFLRSQGGFFISHGFTNFKRIFSQTHNFLRKQTKAAHSNDAERRISSMINKSKTSSRSYLSLSWALLFIVLVKTHIGNPFQWKPPSALLKNVKKIQCWI